METEVRCETLLCEAYNVATHRDIERRVRDAFGTDASWKTTFDDAEPTDDAFAAQLTISRTWKPEALTRLLHPIAYYHVSPDDATGEQTLWVFAHRVRPTFEYTVLRVARTVQAVSLSVVVACVCALLWIVVTKQHVDASTPTESIFARLMRPYAPVSPPDPPAPPPETKTLAGHILPLVRAFVSWI